MRRKLRMRWFFDISKVKESNLTDPNQIFDAHLLETTDLSPSRFHFQLVLYQDYVLSQMIVKLIWTNETGEKKKRCLYKNDYLYNKDTYCCRTSHESALIRNFLRYGRVRGKPIGRVRVNPLRNLNFIKLDEYCPTLDIDLCWENY